jgi:hypothetical protein
MIILTRTNDLDRCASEAPAAICEAGNSGEARGIVRRLIRPFETPGDELYEKKRSRVVESCSRLG